VDWRIKKEVNLHENIFGIRVPPTVLLLTPEQFLKIKRAYLRDYPELKVDLDELLPGRVQSTVAEDVTATLKRKDIKSTTKQALIAARVGQGKFREQVLQMWGQCCAVTRSVTCDVIRASHIIPWSESTDEQRLDPNNGIPLIASLDALFDVGLISFDKSGRLIVSSKLSAEERQLFGLTKKSLTKTPTPEMEVFLAHHRTQHGFEG
jgi:predicted restriction endonuclease